MAIKGEHLGEFEEIVLLAIYNLRNDAYGISIRQALEDVIGRSVSVGAIYATLDRLERKGFIKSWQGEATSERGGRAKRYFEVINKGIDALKEAEEARRKLNISQLLSDLV